MATPDLQTAPVVPPGEELERPRVESAFAAYADADGWVTGRTPGLGYYLRRLVALPHTLWTNRDLIVSSTKRELETRITGTLLGWFWPLVYPVFMFAVYYFVFTKLLAFKIQGLEDEYKAAMGVYMFVGIVAWTGFGEALGRATNVIVENGNLIRKLTFPSEVLPLNVTLVSTVNLLFGVVAFLVACLTPIWPFPDANVLWIFAILPLQVLFTYGLGLFFATLQVFLRDTMQVMTIAITTFMFLTPIFWVPHENVVPGIDAWMPYITANPLYHMVYVWRSALMSRQPEIGFQTSTLDSFVTFAVWTVVVLVVGYLFFLRAQRRFADEV